MTTVLVTGATGFIGLHCIHQLLVQGYTVRGTVRSLSRKPELDAVLKSRKSELDAVPDTDLSRFSVYQADLTRPDGWDAAVAGCDFVLHVASPLMAGVPKHPDDLIKPAVSGTDFVVSSAIRHGVRRVVLTSSIAAITGVRGPKTVFTEQDWTDPDHPRTTAYYQSKTLAERHAWQLIGAQDGATKTELTVINPSVVVGPSLTADIGISNDFIRQILVGKVPLAPRLHFGFVDVRDVAAAHLLAMVHDQAAGSRFIVNTQEMWLIDICRMLRQAGYKKAPHYTAPDWLVKGMGLFDPPTRMLSQLLSQERFTSADRARSILGWQTRDIHTSILETAQQIKDLGLS